jgi:hypothetical protein
LGAGIWGLFYILFGLLWALATLLLLFVAFSIFVEVDQAANLFDHAEDMLLILLTLVFAAGSAAGTLFGFWNSTLFFMTSYRGNRLTSGCS